jgi:hypothetical protein
MGTDHNSGFIFTIDNESKGLDMKGDSEKIVSIGGWGTAGMMRYSCHWYNNLPIALQSAPTPNAKPNSESRLMSSPFDTFLDVKQNDRSPAMLDFSATPQNQHVLLLSGGLI